MSWARPALVRNTSLAAFAAIAAAVACGGGRTSAPPLPPLPARSTLATLSGPLCGEASCRCREGADDAGRPEAGVKRYEVRLGPAGHELWATIDGAVLYKSRERATDCFYLDLRPGVHEVAIRGQHGEGVGFQARIAEQGGDPETWWYDTFGFSCGSPGPCDRAALDDFTRSLDGKKGKLDPCGSTKVRAVAWNAGRLPDHGHPDDLQVSLKLQVYDFSPGHPPGDPACTENPGNQ